MLFFSFFCVSPHNKDSLLMTMRANLYYSCRLNKLPAYYVVFTMASSNTHTQQLPGHMLLFDGTCNLCNASIQFVIRHDKKERFFFAPLQSELAGKIAGTSATDPQASVIYMEKGNMYTESTAALRAARLLRFPVNLLYAFIILPRFIRNPVYRFIAKNRYRWFGKRDQCMVPAKDISRRFLV